MFESSTFLLINYQSVEWYLIVTTFLSPCAHISHYTGYKSSFWAKNAAFVCLMWFGASHVKISFSWKVILISLTWTIMFVDLIHPVFSASAAREPWNNTCTSLDILNTLYRGLNNPVPLYRWVTSIYWHDTLSHIVSSFVTAKVAILTVPK